MQQQEKVRRATRRAVLKEQERRARASLEKRQTMPAMTPRAEPTISADRPLPVRAPLHFNPRGPDGPHTFTGNHHVTEQ